MDEGGLLIGGPGKDHVAQVLAQNAPQKAIRDIQSLSALKSADCGPLLILLDMLGCKRTEAHQHVLESSLKLVLESIPHLSFETLHQLLESSFPFIGAQHLFVLFNYVVYFEHYALVRRIHM